MFYFIFFLYQYGPALAGLLLAVVAFLVIRKRRVALPLAARVATGAGMALALAALITRPLWFEASTLLPGIAAEDQFMAGTLTGHLAPLIACGIALLFLLFPVAGPGPRGSATLAPRTATTFAPRAWLVMTASVLAAVLAVSIAAGAVSSPDEAGRYVRYELRLNAETAAGTDIYGWWFFLPCLVAIAVIGALAFLGLFLISRPALAADAQLDTAIRRARIRGILAVTTGGLLLHLATILVTLAGASSLYAGFTGGDAGRFQLSSAFEAAGPALNAAAIVVSVLGFALWWTALLTAAPVSARRPAVGGSHTMQASAPISA